MLFEELRVLLEESKTLQIKLPLDLSSVVI